MQMVPQRYGLSLLQGQDAVLEKARISVRHMSGVCPGGVLWATVYMHDSVGLAPLNWQLLCKLGSLVRLFGMPYILAGDWNLSPEELSGSGWVQALSGHILAPTFHTCVPSITPMGRSGMPGVLALKRLPDWTTDLISLVDSTSS